MKLSLLAPLFLWVVCQIPTSQAQELPQPPETTWDKMWEIQLIDNENIITSDIVMAETMTFDGQIVDARAGIYYQEMYNHALSQGITLYLRSGYRSIATQRYLYNSGVTRYMEMGYSYSTAITIANRYYATPGGSEHQLGLAFDIITPTYHQQIYTLDSRFAQTEAYTWLMAHCADYGFILSYPADRSSDTGINFEPWHYRYVGVEHAQYIMEHQLILKEYVALYQETYPYLYSDSPPDLPPVEEETAPEMALDDSKLRQLFQHTEGSILNITLKFLFAPLLGQA